jgi:hypothetical protein
MSEGVYGLKMLRIMGFSHDNNIRVNGFPSYIIRVAISVL